MPSDNISRGKKMKKKNILFIVMGILLLLSIFNFWSGTTITINGRQVTGIGNYIATYLALMALAVALAILIPSVLILAVVLVIIFVVFIMLFFPLMPFSSWLGLFTLSICWSRRKRNKFSQ
jgi:hypothetical protein